MRLNYLQNFQIPRFSRSIAMASVINRSNSKKLIQIDISSDSLCPWCYVGKKNLDKAIASSNDRYTFEIKWHPFMIYPSAPKEGIAKKEAYEKFYGPLAVPLRTRMEEVYKSIGMKYDTSGRVGSSLDSHRLIYLAGKQGHDKQHELVEKLFFEYFTQGKFIADREFLVATAEKVGVEGAAEFLADPDNGLKEVNEEIEKYSSHIDGVPHFVINGTYQVSGAQAPEVFLKAFEAAARN